MPRHAPHRTARWSVERTGWLSSVVLHGATFGAVLCWPGGPKLTPPMIAGDRSVVTLQLASMASAQATELPVEVELELETLESSTEPPKSERPPILDPVALEQEPLDVPELVVTPTAELPARKLTAADSADEQPAKKERPKSQVQSVAAPAVDPARPREIGTVDTLPARPRHNPLPDYPAPAIVRGSEGLVTLRVVITAAGDVAAVTVDASSGDALLDHAALDAVRQWTFEPARRRGETIEWVALLPVRFRMR